KFIKLIYIKISNFWQTRINKFLGEKKKSYQELDLKVKSQYQKMRVFENPNFNLSKTMLRKIKSQQYIQDDGTPIPDLVSILYNFKFVHNQSQNKKLSQFIKQLATLVEYQQISEGQFIAEYNTNDTFFILKGEVIALQERSQRSIMQDQFWHKKLQLKKKEYEETFDSKRKKEILSEIEKIERVHKYFSDVLVEEYLRADLFRYSQNFNLEDECIFKEFALIKAGMTFGKNSNDFLISKDNQIGDLQIYIQNELKQRKVKFIAGKNLHIFRLSADSQQILFAEYYENKQKIIEFLQQKLYSLRQNYDLLDLISNRAHQMQLFEDSALYFQNSEKPTHFYFLLKGQVEISNMSIKHSPIITYIEGPNIIGLEFIGEKSQFRQYSAKCRSQNIEVYKISYQEIQNLPNNQQFMEEINNLGLQQNNYFKQLVNQKLDQYKIQRSIFSNKLQQIYLESPRRISAQFFSPQNQYQAQSSKNTQRFSTTNLDHFFPHTSRQSKDTIQSPIKIKENSQSPKFTNTNKQTFRSQNLLSKLSTEDQLNSSHQKLNSVHNFEQDKNEESIEQIVNQKLKQFLIKNQMLTIKTQESDFNQASLYFQTTQQHSNKAKNSSQNNHFKFSNNHRKLKTQASLNHSQNSIQGYDSQKGHNSKIPTSLINQFIPQLQQCFINK
ncbi:hypothetical protein TTHERM_00842720, partial (macronuclear) [Tetrahymena thermophila SB210]